MRTEIKEYTGNKKRTHFILVHNPQDLKEKAGYIPLIFEGHTNIEVRDIIRKALGLNGSETQEKTETKSSETDNVETGETSSFIE